MCGRFALMYDSWEVAEQIQRGFNLEINPVVSTSREDNTDTHYNASFNVSPTNMSAVYKNKDKGELRYMKWGLVPHWTKDLKSFKSYSTFNARLETLQESRLWIHPCKSNRCAVPISGYYEWKTSGTKKGGSKTNINKTPYYVTRSDGKLMFLAGMYDYVPAEDFYSFTIITAPAPKNLKWLHERMPVVIEPGTREWDSWMDPEKKNWSQKELNEILEPRYDEDHMISYQVSPEVGKTTNNGENLIKPILKADKNKFEKLIKKELDETKVHDSIKNEHDQGKLKTESNNTIKRENESSVKTENDNDKLDRENNKGYKPKTKDDSLVKKESKEGNAKKKRNITDMLRSSSKQSPKKQKR